MNKEMNNRLKILGRIQAGDTYAYAIFKSTSYSYATIHSHLKFMETNGLITSVKNGRKKLYELTENGKSYLSQLFEEAIE